MKLIDLFETDDLPLELRKLRSYLASDSGIFLFGHISRLYDAGLNGDNCPMATQLINEKQEYITEYIEGHRSFVVTYVNVALLILFGIKWPWVLHWYDTRKHDTIKLMLGRISMEDYDKMMPILKALKKIHINWPEIAIIDKSVSHEIANLNEGRKAVSNELVYTGPTDHYISVITSTIEAMMAKGNIKALSYTISRLLMNRYDTQNIRELLTKLKPKIIAYMTEIFDYEIKNKSTYFLTDLMAMWGQDLKWPEFTKLLEDNKPGIIKILLTYVSDNFYAIADADIHKLLYLGMRWPELQIILNSVQHEINKKLTESSKKDIQLNNISRRKVI